MNLHPGRSCRTPLLVLTLLVMLPMQRAGASAYDLIKAQEAKFPVPTPSANIPMGTLDVATGQFTGQVSTTVWHPPDQFNRKPYQTLQPPTVNVNAVDVKLTFTALHRPAGQWLTVKANNASAGANADMVTVDVGNATFVQWTLQCGARTYSDNLNVSRPKIVGAGAFTLPALPLVVIYAPPVDQAQKNQAVYATTQTTGTTIGMTFSQSNSTAKPSTPSQFANTNDMKDAMNLTATLISGLGSAIPGGAQIAGAFNTIAGALGDASGNTEVGTQASNGTTLQLTDQRRDTYTTAPGQGPGAGDVILYLRNAQLVWLAQDGQVTLTLLGQQSIDNPSVAVLRADLQQPDVTQRKTRLDNATIAALLRLDPNVPQPGRRPLVNALPTAALFRPPGDPAPSFVDYLTAEPAAFRAPDDSLFSLPLELGPPRYSLEVTYGVFGDEQHEFVHTVVQTDTTTTNAFTTTTDSFKQGFLSFLGVGPNDTSTVKTNVTQSSSRAVTTGTQVTQDVSFHAAAGESYTVEVYYDKVFGVFAYKLIPEGPTMLTGVARDAGGKPAPGRLVTLSVGGRKYQTRTSASGQYAFKASTLKAGAASLQAAGASAKSFALKVGDRQDLVVSAQTPPRRRVPVERLPR